ncbi:uncharacterized protein [Haliotis cracherodii]|uniref:uncharacterized protein n=1 Tax=Haliotis cracherodii TaxID=6455 RepID=UPI0039E8249D
MRGEREDRQNQSEDRERGERDDRQNQSEDRERGEREDRQNQSEDRERGEREETESGRERMEGREIQKRESEDRGKREIERRSLSANHQKSSKTAWDTANETIYSARSAATSSSCTSSAMEQKCSTMDPSALEKDMVQ